MEAAEYVERAKTRIVEVLEQQNAVTYPELEARISEAYNSGDHRNIDPHHVTTARNTLLADGTLVPVSELTRGSNGREVTTVHLNATGKATLQKRAAARK